MIQDLGLHQDAKFLVGEDATIDLTHDLKMRRKVYWGCYIVDKYVQYTTDTWLSTDRNYRVISLYFGRPVSLHAEDAAVDPLVPDNE